MRRLALLRRALIAAATGALGCCCAAAIYAQARVEFPSSVSSPAPYGAPSAVYPSTPYSPPSPGAAPTFDPYANPSLGAPPADIPYNTAPLSTPSPYGTTPYGATPAPYGATTPPPVYGAPVPTSPPTGGTFFQDSSTPQWSNSATYSYQNPDGTVAQLQRFLQQLSVEHTYLWGDHDVDDLAMNRTELAATFGVPLCRNPNTPLLLTPGFAFNWLEGPISPAADLPPRVYDAYLDAAWYPRFSDFLGADLGVRTGVWTDFENVNEESLRILGRGLGVITLSPRMDLLLGVWYLDRNRVQLLPAGGVHWRPGPECDLYLVFPNPKIRRRFVNIGASQWWWYVAGEYGAGRWTIVRDPAGQAGDADDDIDINDLRAIGGLEWETQTQARGHFEVGYVFEREILYAESSKPAEFELENTFMVRMGFDF